MLFSTAVGTKRVVCRDKQGCRALSGHVSRELGMVRVVANNDAGCQLFHPENGNLASSLIDGMVDGPMQLAIQPNNGPR